MIPSWYASLILACIFRTGDGEYHMTNQSVVLCKTLGDVTITTYTMIAYTGKRSAESQRMMDAIEEREWGLLLMDEVHVVPAAMFRKVPPPPPPPPPLVPFLALLASAPIR